MQLFGWPRRGGRVDLPAEVDGECVFCRIAGGRAERSLVGESERAVAFLDVQPAVGGHTLVVPRVHAVAPTGLDPADGAAVWELGVRVGAALRGCGLAAGTNFFLADGVAAGQEVWHVHLHVIPRRPGDGMRVSANWTRPDRAELDATAERVSNAMET